VTTHTHLNRQDSHLIFNKDTIHANHKLKYIQVDINWACLSVYKLKSFSFPPHTLFPNFSTKPISSIPQPPIAITKYHVNSKRCIQYKSYSCIRSSLNKSFVTTFLPFSSTPQHTTHHAPQHSTRICWLPLPRTGSCRSIQLWRRRS